MKKSFPNIISSLLKGGMTENSIVAELREMGVDTTQATINRIKCGRIDEPRYSLGAGLILLYKNRGKETCS